ncbi:MAG: sulfurtransferase TusA [Gammaproteobacteria bacterium]|jgi:tRNA 2-thiouridine synthesizing protein A|nr:sulfurtransferase TusA [Pseudomonadales bacterium]MBT7227757.1 sulfurtransferase TusA [Gammaproteobacteria bacterium]MDB3909154.1 sulfurtransferase TusA [Gammaproteobacteria bacterium]
MSDTEQQSDSDKIDSEQALELDARGLYCPEPVMLLHNKIADIEAGQLLRLIATDPSTTRDVPKFCHFLGHELLESGEQEGGFSYLIRKVGS